jgi:hypothetical protein
MQCSSQSSIRVCELCSVCFIILTNAFQMVYRKRKKQVIHVWTVFFFCDTNRVSYLIEFNWNEITSIPVAFNPRTFHELKLRGCIQKFPDWVDKENNNKHSLRSNINGYGGKLTRLPHKIAIQLHLAAESCTICSSRSRRSVRKLLDTPSYNCHSANSNSSTGTQKKNMGSFINLLTY